MKKTLFTLFFLTWSIISYSQNAIGYSFSDVKNLMTNKGHITKDGYTKKDAIRYLNAYDSDIFRMYFFTDNNVCFMYIFAIKGAEFSDHEKALFDEGYLKVGDKYYQENYVAEIFYNDDLKSWCSCFTIK